MLLLNAWVLFGLIPLYLIYKQHQHATRQIKLIFLSIVFMFMAMARPVVDNAIQKQKFDSQDYIIALDVSYSMQADDLPPSRYEVAKKAIAKLLKKHPKDRFTLFAFTSNTLLISPPTTDTSISMMALNALNPEYILTKSTSLLNLFETIANTSFKKKNLIIFSDGGDEHNIAQLLTIAKENTIIPYIVATATQKGSALKKDGRYLKDIYSSLVISKINPILEDLAHLSGGKYYELDTSLDVIDELSQDITTQSLKQEDIEIKSYYELFYIPLFIALLIYLSAVTKLHQLTFLLLFLLPYKADASLIDSYYIHEANKSFQHKEYLQAAHYFEKATPSVRSYYNIATSYAKAGHCKSALNYYTQIQTHNKKIKQMIFYNMANCAVKLKRYDRAKKLYIQALALGYDKDALENLRTLQKLNLKTLKNIIDMLPPKNAQTKKNSSKKTATQKDDKKSGGGKNNSKQSANQSSNGAGDKKSKNKTQASKPPQNNNYKIGYKAYEQINKGYTNEKEPW